MNVDAANVDAATEAVVYDLDTFTASWTDHRQVMNNNRSGQDAMSPDASSGRSRSFFRQFVRPDRQGSFEFHS